MIYVINHKESDNVYPEGYSELKVGPLFEHQEMDNINHLNPYINELTGLYHIWKNTNDEIVGLNHYRRFFGIHKDIQHMEILTWKKAQKLVEFECDIVLPFEVSFRKPLYQNLRDHFPMHKDIFDKYYEILISKEPNLQEFCKNDVFFPSNLFLMKRELLDDYCSWLFPIIIPLAEQFKAEDADKDMECIYQRMIGYIGERLLTKWVWDRNLLYKRLPVIGIEEALNGKN